MPARVWVVGLGPAGVDHLLPAARHRLEQCPRRYVRTDRHPAIAELSAEGIDFVALDHHYESAATVSDAYEAIANELAAAASEHGEVVYAVPGNPAVAESTPALLAERGVEVVRVAGLSFADLAWTRLGVDPLAGARMVDAHDISACADLSGPLLIAQCDSPRVLSDVKLVLLESLGADTPVTVLRRLGMADEDVSSVPLEDLDRVQPDHLTSVFVDTAGARIAGELAALYELVETLRGPGGCPWDAEQTHHSLARHTLEEAYEVVEAIERLPRDAPGGAQTPDTDDYWALCDELGDLLFQVFIHSVLAREAGAFTLADVAGGIHTKLVRRHPHVFGEVAADSSSQVVANWEQIKKDERGGGSVVDGITSGLPSLVYALKVARKAESLGVAPDALVGSGLPPAVADALASVALSGGAPDRGGEPETADAQQMEAAAGEVLAFVALAARAAGIDAETALRGWATRLADRVRALEGRAEEAGVDLASATADEIESWWDATAGVAQQ